MIKLNRIGNKLGIVGVVGIVLAGGMLVNTMIAEKAVMTANGLAQSQQAIGIHAL